MIRTMINGFCMALADSVPGVSGGTIALILGFMTSSSALLTRYSMARRKRKKKA